MENNTTTSNCNCLNMLNYTSILKQTIGKYIQNYHILEHVQWQHWELRAKLCTEAIFQPYASCCERIFMKCISGFLGGLRRNRNISGYHETYTFSINHSFLVFTFMSSSFTFLSLSLVTKVFFFFLKDRTKKICTYSPDRKERFHLSCLLFAKLLIFSHKQYRVHYFLVSTTVFH